MHAFCIYLLSYVYYNEGYAWTILFLLDLCATDVPVLLLF
jgi:hypothetical protein